MKNQGEIKLIREKQVCERTGLSRGTLWRLRNRGLFPKPFRVKTTRIMRRNSRDIDNFLTGRRIERTNQVG